MPVYTPNETVRFIYTDFINVMNFREFTTLNIYVNSVTGQDSGPGRGSQSSPYKSFKFALNDAMTLQNNSAVIIHLAGANPHVMDDGAVFPEILAPDQITNSPTPTNDFNSRAPLIIRSIPTPIVTIPPPNILSQANNANSGLKEITTTGGFVVNALQGKFLHDNNGVFSRIISNTAAVIKLAYAGPDLVAPLKVEGEGAVITPAVPASQNPTVVMRGGGAPIILFGVEVVASAGGAIQVGPYQQAMFVASKFASLESGFGENSSLVGASSLECLACDMKALNLPLANLQLENCRLTVGGHSQILPATQVTAKACAFMGMSEPFSDGQHSPGYASLTNCLISGGTGNGLTQFGGELEMTFCDVAGSAQSGVSGKNGAQVKLTQVTSSAANGTLGLSLSNGASSEVDATTDLAGTTFDISVGGLTVDQWATFRQGTAPYTFQSISDPASLFQGSLAATPRFPVVNTTASPYAVDNSDAVVTFDASGGGITVNLPPLAGSVGREITFKKIDSSGNSVSIVGDSGETIDGQATQTLLAQWDALAIIGTPTGWINGAGNASTNLTPDPFIVLARFVRPTGNNANDGLTPATAWATLVYACTQVTAISAAGPVFIDITGINEVLPDEFLIPQIDADRSNDNLIPYGPALWGVTVSLNIHSDLNTVLSIPAANILAINIDPVTTQESIVTDLVLVPNAYAGKLISQFGIPFGTIKYNDATTLYTTASSNTLDFFTGMFFGFDADIQEPGATLTADPGSSFATVSCTGNNNWSAIEGVKIEAPQTNQQPAVYCQRLKSGFVCLACDVACFSGLMCYFTNYVYLSNVHPSTGGCVDSDYDSVFQMTGNYVTGINLYGDLMSSGREGALLWTSYVDGCGPLFMSPDISFQVNRLQNGEMGFCEVKNSTSYGAFAFGAGNFTFSNNLFDDCADDAIHMNGPIKITVLNTPAGAGNLGAGIRLLDGAHLTATPDVALTGAVGDVEIGNSGVVTYAAITGAPNSRLSDFGVNGDGSTAHTAATILG